MNFYIGLNIDSITPSEYNIRIDNQIIDYLYKHRVNLKIFYDLEPYDDILLKKEDIQKLVEDCDTILANEIIKTKKCINLRGSMDEPILAFKALRDFCKKAIDENKNIISIGD